MRKLAIILLILLWAPSAFAVTLTGDCSDGCATLEDFLADNVNQITAAINALEALDTTGEMEAAEVVNIILETEIDTSAKIAAIVTNETGSGALVFATSPTLVTPALGTPSALVLTNATGLNAATGISAGTLPVARGGTGVTNSTGTGNTVRSTSPTLVTPALGTPTALVLTNATGLNAATGISAGTLAVARGGTGVTSSTGSGSNVLSTSPTLVTPALGTPSAVVLTNATGTAASLTAGAATALAADPTACTAGSVVTDVAADGTLTCSAIGSMTSGTPTPTANCTGGADLYMDTDLPGLYACFTDNNWTLVGP